MLAGDRARDRIMNQPLRIGKHSWGALSWPSATAPGGSLLVRTVLRAAQACGLATAFVARPREKGPKVRLDVKPEADFDYNAREFVDLARRMARAQRHGARR